MKINNLVIVWSVDDLNTLGLMRELGQSDLRLLFLIKGHADFAAKSQYCKSYHETSSIEEGFDYLINHYSDEEYKPIIIIANDEIVSFVDIHRDEMKNKFILPITFPKGNIVKYIDKITMTALANQVGIPCPTSREMRWNSSLEGIEYPCLLKPSHEVPGHNNEFKFLICKNEKKLKHALRFIQHDSVLILQQYIKAENDVLVYGCRMRDGNIVFAGTLIRDRWTGRGSTSHGYIIDEIPSYVSESKMKKFIETIDYYGLFSFEYGKLDNTAYFYEVNLRNDGTSPFFYQAGANLPLAYVYSCAGLNYNDVPTKVKEKSWFIDEVFDIENVLKRKVSYKKWKTEKNEATVFEYFYDNDPEPGKVVKKRRTKQILEDFILIRFRIYIVFLMGKLGIKKQ